MRTHKHKTVQILIMLTLAAIALWAQTQSQKPNAAPGGNSPSTVSPVNPAPQSTYLRILTPVANQNLGVNFANVRYQLTTPAASAGTPNFLVQLDGNDPVETTATEYDFIGLAPGAHTVTVTIVDANKMPIGGGSAHVQFNVAPQKTPAPTNTPQQGSPRPTSELFAPFSPVRIAQPEIRLAGLLGPPPQLPEDDDSRLPPASSALPLLSVIGFGVLLGGIASAMKTR